MVAETSALRVLCFYIGFRILLFGLVYRNVTRLSPQRQAREAIWRAKLVVTRSKSGRFRSKLAEAPQRVELNFRNSLQFSTLDGTCAQLRSTNQNAAASFGAITRANACTLIPFCTYAGLKKIFSNILILFFRLKTLYSPVALLKYVQLWDYHKIRSLRYAELCP